MPLKVLYEVCNQSSLRRSVAASVFAVLALILPMTPRRKGFVRKEIALALQSWRTNAKETVLGESMDKA
jgi:hypothetical protein